MQDAEVVAGLLHDFNVEFDAPTPRVEVLTSRLRMLLAGGQTFAIIAGNPALAVALVTLRPNVWYHGPVALLDELYVMPDRRGEGIGSEATAGKLQVSFLRDDPDPTRVAVRSGRWLAQGLRWASRRRRLQPTLGKAPLRWWCAVEDQPSGTSAEHQVWARFTLVDRHRGQVTCRRSNGQPVTPQPSTRSSPRSGSSNGVAVLAAMSDPHKIASTTQGVVRRRSAAVRGQSVLRRAR